eukprot:CAMPEP_0181116370 /NCGR_PEP_ID=MMETSP1071-20121207/21913_1 /TAXON_ID=35127 /ORGANISM="Thalassiosira sp., Strain NH16" /LENGTH=67 /DNA_ID=CAMNT_0023200607 /DNA_START=61 /DNA_END=260 /DNA_ORIENTATION=-
MAAAVEDHIMTMDHGDDDDDVHNGGIIEETHQQQPISLHTLPARRFYLTRRGKILQSTTERYLRDDL